MLLQQINVGTELVSRVFEFDSYGTEMLILGIPVYSGSNALVVWGYIRCRSRGIWHRPSELSLKAT